MRIGYVATDEVNQALAARMAAKCGAIICHLHPGEVHPDGLLDAVLYNLDDVPRDQQPAFLEELCLGTPDCPTAMVSPMSRPRPCAGTASPSRNASTRPCSAACARRACARRHDGVARPSHPTAP